MGHGFGIDSLYRPAGWGGPARRGAITMRGADHQQRATPPTQDAGGPVRSAAGGHVPTDEAVRDGRSSDEPEDAGLRRYGWLILAAVVVIACYSPVLFYEYGFSEDYRMLAAARRGGGLSTLLLAEGRPGFAIWARVVFGGFDTIASLAWIRLLNISVLAAVAVMLAIAWRRAGLRLLPAALAGAATMTLPPFQLFAGTAAMGGVPFGMALAGGAAFLAESRADPSGLRRTAKWIAACALLTAALATYQPAGLFYLVFAAILLVAARPAGQAFTRGLVSFASIAVPAMVVAFALFLYGRSAWPAELLEIGAPRGTLAFDPLAKLYWFMILPLPRALSFWKLWPSLTLAFVHSATHRIWSSPRVTRASAACRPSRRWRSSIC
jgi:hypothetical protein